MKVTRLYLQYEDGRAFVELREPDPPPASATHMGRPCYTAEDLARMTPEQWAQVVGPPEAAFGWDRLRQRWVPTAPERASPEVESFLDRTAAYVWAANHGAPEYVKDACLKAAQLRREEPDPPPKRPTAEDVLAWLAWHDWRAREPEDSQPERPTKEDVDAWHEWRLREPVRPTEPAPQRPTTEDVLKYLHEAVSHYGSHASEYDPLWREAIRRVRVHEKARETLESAKGGTRDELLAILDGDGT